MTETAAEAPTEKRGPGRPKGLGRVPGSGRKRGTPNRCTADVRQFILDHANPYPLLADVLHGRKIRVADPANPTKTIRRYPTAEERLVACRALAPKIAADMKAMELTGAEGGPIRTADVTPEERAKAWRELLGQDGGADGR